MIVTMKPIKLTVLLEYALALFMVLDVNFMWSRSKDLGDYLFNAMSGATLAVLILLALLQRVMTVSGRDAGRLVGLVGLGGLYLAVSRFQMDLAVLQFLLPLLLFAFYETIRKEMGEDFQLLHRISSVVQVIAVVSLFIYVFGTLLDVLPSQTTSYYWGGNRTCVSYFDIYFEAQQSYYIIDGMVRNCGCFTEAPMYSFVLCIALMVELFLREESRRGRVILLMATILTTLTMGGILVGGCMLLYKWIISYKEVEDALKVFFKGLTQFLLGLGVVFMAAWMVSAKSSYGLGVATSYGLRMDDLNACLTALWEKPLAGWGYRNMEAIWSRMGSFRNEFQTGLSTGLGVLLAQGGLLLGGAYLAVSFRGALHRYTRPVAAFFLMLYATTNVPYKMICIYLAAWMLMSDSLADDPQEASDPAAVEEPEHALHEGV